MTKKIHFSNFDLFVELIRDPERKPLLQMTAEVIKLMVLYKSVPFHYFSRYLFKSHQAKIKNYLPNKMLYNLKAKFNEKEVREVLENKLYFDFFYRQFALSLPKIVMYNHRACFVVGQETHMVHDVEDFKSILIHTINTRLLGNPIFIKKMYRSYGGVKIFKLTLESVETNPALLNAIYHDVIATGYIFQETIKQHPDLDTFNPSCLNTLRIDTFINQNGAAEVISCYFKTNIKNHFIDNESVGGCEIPVNFQTGRLKKYGFLTLKTNGLKQPTEHPITHVAFENFQIPHFEEAKKLVLRAASFLPGLRLVGWDVGVGLQGPILVEGNSDYDIPSSDLSYGGYKTNPVFQKVLEEIKD